MNLTEKILNDFVSSSQVQVGDKLPTVRQMAQHYSVSTHTISKAIEVLSVKGWISKRRGSGVYVSRPMYGKKNPLCQDIKRIGFIANRLAGSLVHDILDGVQSISQGRGVALEVAKSQWQVKREKWHIHQMYEQGIEGVVLFPTCVREEQSEYLAKELRDFPILVVDLYQPTMKRPHVIFDNVSAGREMTHYLMGRGCKRIAFITLDNSTAYRSVDDRVIGYRQAIQEAGRPEVVPQVVSYESRNDFESRHLFQVVDRLISSDCRVDAIIAPCDGHAIPVINHLRSLGISVPNDIIVAGFDNVGRAQTEHWPTTNPDFIRMGERTAEILFDLIETRKVDTWEMMLACPLLTDQSQSLCPTRLSPTYAMSLSPASVV